MILAHQPFHGLFARIGAELIIADQRGSRQVAQFATQVLEREIPAVAYFNAEGAIGP